MHFNGAIVILWLLLELLLSSFGQIYNTTTTPPTIDGVTPLITAAENVANTNLSCSTTQISDGTQFATQWSLSRDSEPTVFFLFQVDGSGQTFFENLRVTSFADFRSTLTILVFNSSFDNTQIGCGQENMIFSRFDLRITSQCVVNLIIIIIVTLICCYY